jgi:hypothetical protein
MAKSKAAEELDDLQARLRPMLKDKGFRVQSRTFNRTTSDGLTHVIHFQVGRFAPPGTIYIPWFRRNLYGKFTVNIGVYVPEVAKEQYGVLRSFAQEVECCVRERLGELGPERSDRWWDLPVSSKDESELRERLELDAIPFLARFESRDSVLEELGKAEAAHKVGGAPRITRAIILAHGGNPERARELLSEQIRLATSEEHSKYVQKIATQPNLGRVGV